MRVFSAMVLAALLAAGSADAQRIRIDYQAHFIEAFPGAGGDPYRITHSLGGDLYQFLMAAEAVKHGVKKKIIIDGFCASACVVFADVVRKYACITPRARFGIHRGTMTWKRPGVLGAYHIESIYYRVPHSADIDTWIDEKGGQPYEGLLMMEAHEARKFWKAC